ncbi:hypothetical protein C7821_110303 [Streptomyces sp. VMFN-G11Ma]|jgi:hypothetical protein|nr:hypothetical protein C7821_110303 [Streptomyces sp. VMFN-G11Ma]
MRLRRLAVHSGVLAAADVPVPAGARHMGPDMAGAGRNP